MANKYILRTLSATKPATTYARMMSSQEAANQVIHDKENMEFYIRLGRDKAYLQYDVIDEAQPAVDLQHTVVPEVYRGQGIAKFLAKAAFDHCVTNNLRMKLTCWYLQKYYQENPLPQYQERVIP